MSNWDVVFQYCLKNQVADNKVFLEKYLRMYIYSISIGYQFTKKLCQVDLKPKTRKDDKLH